MLSVIIDICGLSVLAILFGMACLIGVAICTGIIESIIWNIQKKREEKEAMEEDENDRLGN